MPARVLAVWFDAAETALVEEMMAMGEMPTLAALRARGVWGQLRGGRYAVGEAVYGQVITGQPPERTGAWKIARFDAQRYMHTDHHDLTYSGMPPFFALGNSARVAVFDVSQVTLRPDVEGIQLLAWGAHSPRLPLCAEPPELLDEVLARFGEHPARADHDYAVMSDPASLADLLRRILAGLELRAGVTSHLLERDSWDLFITAFGEMHAGGHYFWPHPDCEAQASVGGAAAIRNIYRAADEVFARMLNAAGPEAHCVAFSATGMRANIADLPGGAFLPELLFRYSFPGCVGLDFDDPARGPSEESLAGIQDWVMEVWHTRRRPTPTGAWLFRQLPTRWALALAGRLGSGVPLIHPSETDCWGFQPVTWYQPFWPHMKAFALLTNSDGFIRLNVRGREAHGAVEPENFARVCDDIADLCMELRIPETGMRAVSEVIRVRDRFDASPAPLAHDADLAVVWNPGIRQCILSPRFGQFGPLPILRAGGHTTEGFLCAAGPGIAPGTQLAEGTLLDIGSTVLDLLGVRHSLPGRCLLPEWPVRLVA
jgi:predicted AlkP superfamily phosphohydrolase/phosphomutase